MAVAMKTTFSLDKTLKQEPFKQENLNIDFFEKLKFESEIARLHRQNRLFKLPRKSSQYDIWKQQPPDFNAQAFEPVPLKRGSREAIKPWEYDKFTSFKSGTAPDAKERKRNDKRINDFLNELERSAHTSSHRAQTCDASSLEDLKLRFKAIDSQQAKIDFVRTGQYKPGMYEMPKLHDYRQYPPLKSLGLPEFVTAYERDSLGLKCKNDGLSIMRAGSSHFLRNIAVRTKSEYAMPRSLKWDEKLILPKLPFPNKYAAYTRHRRTDRSAKSAYLERAEDMMERRKKEIEQFKKEHSTRN